MHSFFCRWYFESVTIFTEYKREIKGQSRRSDWGGEMKQHWLKFKHLTGNLPHSGHLKHYSLNIELQPHFYISCKSFKNALNYWEFKSSISRHFFPNPGTLRSATINWFIVGEQQLCGDALLPPCCSWSPGPGATPVPPGLSHSSESPGDRPQRSSGIVPWEPRECQVGSAAPAGPGLLLHENQSFGDRMDPVSS